MTTAATEARLQPLRLHPGNDLRDALEQWLRAAGPGASAWVVSGIGSLAAATLRYAARDEPTAVPGPLEIVSLAGSLSVDGAHLHMTVSDAGGRVLGGHVARGNVVRTTAELLVAWLPAGTLRRAHDAATGYAELVVRHGPGDLPIP